MTENEHLANARSEIAQIAFEALKRGDSYPATPVEQQEFRECSARLLLVLLFASPGLRNAVVSAGRDLTPQRNLGRICRLISAVFHVDPDNLFRALSENI
jgi:hypothetical protein